MSDTILFERSAAAMLVSDAAGRVLDANEAARELLGYAPARLLSLTIAELLHSDDREPRPAAALGAPGTPFGGRRRLRHADGSYRAIDVRDRRLEDGRVLSVLDPVPASGEAHADADDRKRTEEDLRRYELLAQHMRDIVLFVGPQGRILEANAAAVHAYGFSREELLARTIYDLRVPGSEALVERQMAEADQHGVLFETEHRRRDGSVFPVEVSSRGALIGGSRTLLSVVRDISERRRAEAALRDVDTRKNEFLAVLSHELRNPLAPIRNSLHVLEHESAGSERASRARAVLQRQVSQLSRLIDDLLDVTRISQGKVRLKHVPLDFAELVRRTTEDHRSVFEERAVDLQLRAWPQPLPVLGDPNRLAQVIGNLLHNAAKFTTAGGGAIVELAEDAEQRQALVRVTDTGVGMVPETVDQLFEPFAQADRSLDRSNGGLGLGLALVKRLVALHGGQVSASSAGVGQGAEFVVRLPLADAQSLPARANEPAPGQPRRVLVVEDNRDAAESLREALELDGHEVTVEFSGPAGLERARQLEPDVVLCDIGLPGMSGYEFARQLRASARRPRLVALSGYALPADVASARDAGFDDHLAKPASFEALRRVLGTAPLETDGPAGAAEP